MSSPQPPHTQHTRRAPAQSVFYDRILPIVLIALAALMVLLILIAAGVLLGVIHYR